MKILYSWLKDYIDLDLTPAQMEQKFLALGIEVSEIKTILHKKLHGVKHWLVILW